MEELMKDRIRLVMENQHQTQKVFANFIGMSEGALSSIFNGRTKPTLNIVEAIKNKIPKISTDWLLFGRGEMFEKDPSSELHIEDQTSTSHPSFSADTVLNEGQKTFFHIIVFIVCTKLCYLCKDTFLFQVSKQNKLKLFTFESYRSCFGCLFYF